MKRMEKELYEDTDAVEPWVKVPASLPFSRGLMIIVNVVASLRNVYNPTNAIASTPQRRD